MRFIILSLSAILPVFLGVIYLIYDFSNTPQDVISYDDF